MQVDAVTIRAKQIAARVAHEMAPIIERELRGGDNVMSLPRSLRFERKGYRDEAVLVAFTIARDGK